ncbi:Lrp/AsnC family transcriptional regulator [Rhodospirillum sp. A1_3_36]|uniref:Lrp/AsnC family transcriptional regulator n=1 Tax=Rhodospirillum sp. A1_3_36 TaxID=3391666 RepID=UPI0039A70ACB
MTQATRRDSLDHRILDLLKENARVSTSDMAKSLRVARSTVHERITKLERNGTIRGYTAIIEEKESTSHVRGLLMIKARSGRGGLLASKLRDFPEIRECMALSGEYDLFCAIEAPLLEDLDAILEEVGALPEVLSTQFTVILASKFDRKQLTPVPVPTAMPKDFQLHLVP